MIKYRFSNKNNIILVTQAFDICDDIAFDIFDQRGAHINPEDLINIFFQFMNSSSFLIEIKTPESIDQILETGESLKTKQVQEETNVKSLVAASINSQVSLYFV